MNSVASSADGSRSRCLVLLLEPTPYILPRALYLKRDRDLGVDLYFIFRNASQPWGDDADTEGVPVLLDRSLSLSRRVRNVSALLGRILRGDYAAAHLAGWAHWLVRLAIVACRVRGVPFAVESDTPLPIYGAAWREAVKSRLYPLWMRWITFAIPGGSRQAAYFRHYGVPEEKILVSHMTVDTAKIREMKTDPRDKFREAHGIPISQVVFLYVGRLIAQKGIDTLLAAFEIAAVREPNLGLVIVGDGPESDAIEDVARRFPGRIRLVGRQTKFGVISWMRSSDVLILPSRDDNWGLVVNEAMVCGLPVIVSDGCGCVDDLVCEGENGFAFPIDDTGKLADSMLLLGRSPEKRAAMGRQSEKVIAPWVIERQAETIRSALLRMRDRK